MPVFPLVTLASAEIIQPASADVFNLRRMVFGPDGLPTGASYLRASAATVWASGQRLNASATNSARFYWEPLSGAFGGILIEPQRTNLVPYSACGTVGWSARNGATLLNTSANAWQRFGGLRVTANGDALAAAQSASFTLTRPQAYSVTVYYRAGSGSSPFQVRVGSLATVHGTPGALATTYTNSAYGCALSNVVNTNYGASLYGISFVLTTTGSGTLDSVLEAGPGATSGDVIMLAAQVEAGSMPTSHIATTASAATRAADDLRLHLPFATNTVTFVFDDGSKQSMGSLPGGPYNVPANLNRPVINTIEVK